MVVQKISERPFHCVVNLVNLIYITEWKWLKTIAYISFAMYRAQYRICVEGHSNAMSHHLELAGRIDSGGGPELSSEFEWSRIFLKTWVVQNFS